jgi:L-amino acid N-acyltransferase YncA
MQIRDAAAADVPAISALYNALIATTTVAWTEVPEDLDSRKEWFKKQQRSGNPVLVAEADGAVIGFASYGDFRDATKWPGYRFTVEHTIHVDGTHQGEGVGRTLLETLIARAAAQGKHVMIGAVDAGNAGSIRFHQRLGFTEVARLPQVGFKFEHWLDLVLVHRFLDPG